MGVVVDSIDLTESVVHLMWDWPCQTRGTAAQRPTPLCAWFARFVRFLSQLQRRAAEGHRRSRRSARVKLHRNSSPPPRRRP
jgi:hypothetical protein